VRSDSPCYSSPAHAIVMWNIASPIAVVVSIQGSWRLRSPAATGPEVAEPGGVVEHGADRAVQPPYDDEVQVATLSQLDELALPAAAAHVVGAGLVHEPAGEQGIVSAGYVCLRRCTDLVAFAHTDCPAPGLRVPGRFPRRRRLR
jgi:hypothetical protein